jgi:hypothetical protein
MTIKSFGDLDKSPIAKAKRCEEILFQRFMQDKIKTKRDLAANLTAIALHDTTVGRLVSVSTTVYVLDTLLTGSWLH